LNRIASACFAGGRQQLVLTHRLAELGVPAQVIWGAEDRILPVAHCRGLPAAIPVSVLAGAGHLVHMEKAAEVNALIERLVG
jgi:pyruvate dehydrogenase E2 component (dihydrolipoamide acetyltransferase)